MMLSCRPVPRHYLAMIFTVVLALLLMPPRSLASGHADSAVVSHIRAEGQRASHVMEYAFMLTDVLGPRMTGTPSFRESGEWAMEIFRDLNLHNVHAEPIDWGRGWVLDHVSLHLIEPQVLPLIGVAVPWSPPTGGTVEGNAVQVTLPEWETPAAYRTFFNAWRGRLANAIILATDEVPRERPEYAELIPTRLTDDQLRERIARLEVAAQEGDAQEGEHANGAHDPALFSSAEFFAWQDSLHTFLREEGVLGVLYATGGHGGTIPLVGPMRVTPAWLRHAHQVLPPPTFVLASEHYERLLRLLETGHTPRLRLHLEASFPDDPSNAYNVVAEIPGTDRADELVMVGAHLDGWPLATAATDNAAGVAVVMEAVRILRTLDLPMRRTVRVVLWGGHEGEGLGSRTHVHRHFDAGYPTTWLEEDEEGRTHEPHPNYENLFAYFNLDYLAGRIRGLFLQNNEAVRPVFEDWLAPFAAEGARHLANIVAGGSDHMAFHDVGLNAFPFIQDGSSFDVSTHHSNMDVFDYLDEEDLRQSAIILAAVLYRAAMSQEDLKSP